MALVLSPMYDRILVRRDAAEEKVSEGGIVIAAGTGDKGKTSRGRVVAVGEGRLMPDGTLQPLKVKVGDTVFFSRFNGHELEWQNKVLLSLDESMVIAVLKHSDQPMDLGTGSGVVVEAVPAATDGVLAHASI